MSADGTINIDILLNKKEEFLNDVKNIDNVLNKLGENFGEKMDTSFSNETKDVENKAKVTKKEIEDTFNKPIRCAIKADSSDASKKIISTKDFLKEIPKEKISKLKVNNEGAIPNIKVTKKEIEKVPNEKEVSFKIKNQEAINNIKKVGKAEDEVKEKSTKLKDVLAGTFAGTLIANGISTITSKLHEALEAGMEFDKEQDTMRTVWKALTEEAPQDGEKLINFINDVSNHSIFTAESIDKMAQSFYHVHSNTEETERWTTSLVALGSTLHMTNERVSEAGEMFAKVMASGKAGAQDIYMMINRFPMFGEALQKVSGKTMEDLYKLSAQGKLTSEVFGQAMDYLGNKYKKGTEEAMTSMQGMSMYISKRWQQLWGQAESNTFNSSKRISKTIENLLSDDKISSYANALSNAFAGTLGWVTKVLDYIDRRKDTIMTIGSNIGTILGIIRDTAWNTFKEILSTISNLLDDTNENGKKAKDPLNSIKDILNKIAKNKTAIETITKLTLAFFALKKATSIVKGICNVLGFLSKFVNPIGLVVLTIGALAVGLIYAYNHSETFRKGVNKLFGDIKEFAEKLYKKYIGPLINSVMKCFSKWGDQIKKWWNENGVPLQKAVKNFGDFLYHVFETPLNYISGLFYGIWHGIVRELKIVWDTISTVIDGGIKIVEGILDIFIGVFTGNWSKAWEGIKGIFSGALEAVGGILKGGIDTLGNIALSIGEAIGNAVVGGINGVIDGIDWISEKLTGHKTKIHHVKKLKLTKNEKGTNNHPGGLMMVNDQEGDIYEELIIPKNGTPYIPKGRNVILNELAGAQVVPAPLTKLMVDFGMIPRFEKGTGFWTELWDSAKNIVGDIWDYATHPSKLVNIAVNKFAEVKSDAKEVVDLGWGGIKYLAKQAIDWVKNLFASTNSVPFDGAMNANGVFQYLVDIATQTIKKFGMSGITSGYRPGDPYWHGKHQAIDIAYPSSMNGSSKYFDPANWVFENFADKVGYVITQGKVRDRTGQSGQPATGQWEPWPDNDHYDHLHITGRLGSGDIFKAGGGSSPAGLGAERWRSRVIEAAKMVGFPTDKGHIDRIIRQIQTESGGNERAVQGGYTDINTITGDLAKGLMQTISATFNAYKMPGHGNIFNGYDNILAGLRYIMARYGTGAGFFANIGMGHGYANGGWATEPSIFGEIPGQPEVAINPKRDSADKLIVEAIKARAEQAPNSLSAKINQVLLSAKENVQSFVPEIGLSAGGSKKILPENNQTVSKGDIHLKVVLDNGEIFKAQYPLHKAMEAHELIIEQAKVGVENG